jgi:Ca2+-transporting ATPase
LYGLSGAGYEPEGSLTLDGKTVEWTPRIRDLLKAAALCSDACIVKGDEGWKVQGDPTEGALIVAARKAGLEMKELETAEPRIDEIPFSSERKRMTTLHTKEGKTVAYSKGAAEMVLASCTQEIGADGIRPLTPERKKVLEARIAELALKALRLIAVAEKSDTAKGHSEKDMTLLGIVGMIDPPRPEAKEAIETCKKAGIKVIMITGDNPLTAKAIATELGLLDGGKVLTGTELDAIDDESFAREVQHVDVYARVSPAHKLRVVGALQKLGHVVAMTGDGVNDAPALKKADIGVAMGITGTDVTKEAGAMTLMDDNFSSIVASVEEGRIIFGNIKKYLMYLLSSNIGEILIVGGSTLLGLPLPLTAVQLLTINLATDGLPALALAVDPPTHNVMTEKPRNAQTGIFSRSVVVLMLTGSIWSALVNLGFFWWMLSTGHSLGQAMTTTFLTLNFLEFAKAYAFRSGKDSIIQKPFGNRWLNLSVAVELLLLILIITVPFFHGVFQLSTIGMKEWIAAILLALSVIPVLELMKWRLRKMSS